MVFNARILTVGVSLSLVDGCELGKVVGSVPVNSSGGVILDTG